MSDYSGLSDPGGCGRQDIIRSLKPIRNRAHCFHMKVKVAVLNAISQNFNFFEVKLVPYASLCLGNYLDQFFVKF